jgi:carboxymethylenebutenolidase
MSEHVGPRFPVYITGDPTSARSIVVLQEGFGVNRHIRTVADRFADAGFFAVAPHLYHRDGSPEISYYNIEQAKLAMSHLSLQGLQNDLDATTDFLTAQGYGFRSIGAVGFCMGGSVAFYAATTPNFGAAVSFYGGGITTSRMGLPPLLDLASELQVPWLGVFGDLDEGIPVADVEALRAATSSVAVTTEIVRYADAHHGFHNEERPSVHDEVDAADAFEHAVNFLNANLVGT